MSPTYLSLILTILLGLFYKNTKILFFAIIITNLVGLYYNVINLAGIGSLALLALLTFLYSNFYRQNKIIQILLFASILTMISGLVFHLIPGFFNDLILDKIRFSAFSCPFSMYMNFDKVMAALIIYSITSLHVLETTTPAPSFKNILILTPIAILIILSTSYIVGYVEYDPKLPNHLLIWIINNFFFVCFAEEVIFRGFIQRNISRALAGYASIPYMNIIIVSLIFGMTHYKGGPEYIVLASIASFFYGYIYQKTNRILYSMIAHFGVNLCHLMLFTYPTPLKMCM